MGNETVTTLEGLTIISVVEQATFMRATCVMHESSKQIAMSSVFYLLLGTVLFLTSFGISGLYTFLLLLLGFIFGLFVTVLNCGYEVSVKNLRELNDVTKKFRFLVGHQEYLTNRGRFSENTNRGEQEQPMTNSATIDAILEQMLSYVIRDFVDSWYSNLTPDHNFKESLKRSAMRTIAAFSQCVQKVDFVPLLTQHIVDDIASHFRLFRRAKERAQLHYGKNYTTDELETMFFDLELEMEKCYCRDLVSTCPHYENAYFHDVADILLYLLTPAEDFRSRPFRFLLREVYVKRMMLPLFDMLSDPDFINHSIIWLLSETNLKPEDFIAILETTDSMKVLDAVLDSLCVEAAHLRTKDSGGEQGFLVKQQLASIDYAINTIKRRMDALAAAEVENDLEEVFSFLYTEWYYYSQRFHWSSLIELQLEKSIVLVMSKNDRNKLQATRKLPVGNSSLVQLPIHVVLSNNMAVTHFADFLASVGGQALIDCYLAIEGFKVSVEHQLRGLAVGETLESDAYETVKEAANFLYQQYLSQEAVTRVSLDDVTVKKLLMRIRNDDPPDTWFEQVQAKIVDILRTDERFYDCFKRSSIYIKMLNELGLGEDISCQTTDSQYNNESNIKSPVIPTASEAKILNDIDGLKHTHVGMHVVVETLGIGQQGKQSFALYNVRVSRIDTAGKQSSTWNVLRRYSDFHTLNSLIQSRSILQPSVLEANADLETLIFDFLSMKDYIGEREGFPKKVMSAVFEPLKSGVRAFGNAVTAMPDTVYDGVTRVGDGINKAAKQIIDFQPTQGLNGLSSKKDDLSRVAAVYNDQQWMESIPLRVLVLLIGEVFDVRSQNAWFRRRLVALLNQFVHATMGSSLNRKIIDIVQWLTSKQQVAQYLVAFRNTLWPDGKLAESSECRSEGERLRTCILARAQMLSALPDELRLFIGAETTNRGIANVSEVFQNSRLNRRLLYVIFERLLASFFPDNHFEKIFPQLHAKSPRSKPLHV
uniref:Sorting nexin-13 n=1 Tax=Elaeophora elaphi TaxID=1147741 RepID=A0A0R3RWV7_9BILA